MFTFSLASRVSFDGIDQDFFDDIFDGPDLEEKIWWQLELAVAGCGIGVRFDLNFPKDLW